MTSKCQNNDIQMQVVKNMSYRDIYVPIQWHQNVKTMTSKCQNNDIKMSKQCHKMSPNGIKSVTFGVNFHSDACSEHPRVSRNVTKTCHKTFKWFRAEAGSEHTPVQSIRRFMHTSVQSIHRFSDPSVQSIFRFRACLISSRHRFRAYIGSEPNWIEEIRAHISSCRKLLQTF